MYSSQSLFVIHHFFLLSQSDLSVGRRSEPRNPCQSELTWNKCLWSLKLRPDFDAFRIREAASKAISGLWIQKSISVLFLNIEANRSLLSSAFSWFSCTWNLIRLCSEDRSPKYFSLWLCLHQVINACSLLIPQPWHSKPELEGF